MTVELTEEDMPQALFGAAHAPAPQLPVHDPMAHIPDVVIAPPAVAARKKKPGKAFTPRLQVTLQVGNVFEGLMRPNVHEADTLSTLLAEQEAVRVAKKRYRYFVVASVKAMGVMGAGNDMFIRDTEAQLLTQAGRRDQATAVAAVAN